MNTSILPLTLVLLVSTACLAPKLKADFETDLKRWVGQPIAAFIKAREDPMETKPRPQGGHIYVFELHKPQGPGDPVRFANADVTLGEVAMDLRAPRHCRLTLETGSGGLIVSTRWEGNDCW
ncbi:MAG: hypothetical protein U0P46_01980 [Holophagaceae bacterium]